MYLIFFLMWKLSAYRKFFASKLQGGQPSVSKLPAFVKRLKLTKAANYFASFSMKKNVGVPTAFANTRRDLN